MNLDIKCRKIETQRTRFASLQVTAECEDPNILHDPSIWPIGAFVRRYYEPRRPRQGVHGAEVDNRTNTDHGPIGVGVVRLPNLNEENIDRGMIGEDGLPNQPGLGENLKVHSRQ